MDDDVQDMVVGVRADTAGFARDVAQMRDALGQGLGDGAARAGRLIEASLVRAVRTGSLGFDDLKGVAIRALDQIAAAALRGGIASVTGGASLGALLGGLLGAPGRATGGPVSPGRPYMVGERGPEVFVPTTSGRIEVPAAGGGARDVRVAITVNAAAGDGPETLRRSSRQVARAVKAALEG